MLLELLLTMVTGRLGRTVYRGHYSMILIILITTGLSIGNDRYCIILVALGVPSDTVFYLGSSKCNFNHRHAFFARNGAVDDPLEQ